jgi:general secretion pathway protein C
MSTSEQPQWTFTGELVELLGLAVAALLTAQIVGCVVAGLLVIPPLTDESLARRAAREQRPTLALDRVFGLGRAPVAAPGPAGPTVGPASPLRLALAAPAVGQDARWNRALIRNLAQQTLWVVVEGDRRDGVTVVSILGEEVVVEVDGRLESLALFAPPAGAVAIAAPGAPAVAAVAAGSPAVLTPQARDQLLGSFAQLATQVRLAPALADGVMAMRVVSLQPGSPLTQLGLQAGDVVKRIDGVATSDLEGMLGVLQRARTATRLQAEVSRGGQPVTLGLEVRAP